MLELIQPNNFREVISLIRSSRRSGTRTYSYRQLAEKFGYSSPRTLAMVHKGQRAPSALLVRKFIKHFELSSHEAELLTLLAEKSSLERKHISTTHLNEKMNALKKTIERMKRIQNAQASDIEAASVFLNIADLKKIGIRLRDFLLELSENFSKNEEGKEHYQIIIRIRADSS